jgi:hypothetical protein
MEHADTKLDRMKQFIGNCESEALGLDASKRASANDV